MHECLSRSFFRRIQSEKKSLFTSYSDDHTYLWLKVSILVPLYFVMHSCVKLVRMMRFSNGDWTSRKPVILNLHPLEADRNGFVTVETPIYICPLQGAPTIWKTGALTIQVWAPCPHFSPLEITAHFLVKSNTGRARSENEVVHEREKIYIHNLAWFNVTGRCALSFLIGPNRVSPIIWPNH